jgi:RHS repeat-associated protein
VSYDALNQPLSFTFGSVPAQTAPTASSSAFSYVYNSMNQTINQTATDNSWWSYPTTASSLRYSTNGFNQYTAVGAVTPTYDGNGNLTFDGTFTYGYDAESRLTSVAQSGTPIATYAYDAQGRRKSKTVGATTTNYLLDPSNRALFDYDGSSGQIARWYSFGSGLNEVLNQINVSANTRMTFIPDTQGSVIGTLDSGSGAITKTGYQVFGESPSTAGTFRYTGARIDAETNGLYDFRARMYSAALGRFLQPDPIGYSGGTNLYTYTDNDPLNQTDPSGNCPACIGAISSVAIGYGITVITGQSYTWQNALTDAALGAVGAGLASKVKTAYQLAEAGTGISKARYLGALGEEAVGATDARQGVQVGGSTLFPDIVNPNGLGEVKNVATIGARDANQISSYAAYSARRGLDPVQVFTRQGTDVSRIQRLINSGAVEQQFIRGVNDLGVYSLTAGQAALTGGAVGAVDSGVRSLK